MHRKMNNQMCAMFYFIVSMLSLLDGKLKNNFGILRRTINSGNLEMTSEEQRPQCWQRRGGKKHNKK